MIATLALIAVAQSSALPAVRDFSAGGIPYLVGDGATRIAVPAHSFAMEFSDAHSARATSTTLFKNSGGARRLTLLIPFYRVVEDTLASSQVVLGRIPVEATWDKAKLSLRGPGTPILLSSQKNPDQSMYSLSYEVQVDVAANATHSLKVSYTQQAGRTGYEFKQAIFGYALTGKQPIEQLNLAYRSSGDAVFKLPTPSPALGWQVGTRGAFVRLNKFTPTGTFTYVSFYPGGFEDIGG